MSQEANTPAHGSQLPWYAGLTAYLRTKCDHDTWTDRDAGELEFYANLIQPGDLCFDIGAHLGFKTKIFRALGSRVIAAEPQSACADTLRAIFRNDANVTVVHKAVSDGEGVADISLSPNAYIATFSEEWKMSKRQRDGSLQWNASEMVEVTTIDALIGEYGRPTFIKIDVEGSELNVLKGLSSAVRCLSFEFTPEYLSPAFECIERLSLLGNPVFNCTHGFTPRMLLPTWVTADGIVGLVRTYDPSDTDCPMVGDIYARFDC